LSTGITSGIYLPVADSTGIIKLLQASATANQVLTSDGTNVLWGSFSGIGALYPSAVLTEEYNSGNNGTYYTTTPSIVTMQLASNASSALILNPYQRVFTQLDESLPGSVVTATSGIAYTNAVGGQCFFNFTLGTGKYLILGSYPANLSLGTSSTTYVRHFANLELNTGGTPLIYGTHETSASTGRSVINGIITLVAPTTLRIRHYIIAGGNVSSARLIYFGFNVNTTNCVYGTMTIFKIA